MSSGSNSAPDSDKTTTSKLMTNSLPSKTTLRQVQRSLSNYLVSSESGVSADNNMECGASQLAPSTDLSLPLCLTVVPSVESVQLRIDEEMASSDPNLPFGDEMSCPKSPDTLRVYFQNANSIRSERMEKWLDACVCMRAKEVDIFGLAEINVNPRHPGLTEEISLIAKRNWTHASTTLVNSDTDCCAWAQQGGTSITATRKWISHLVEKGQDGKLGRWLYHILRD